MALSSGLSEVSQTDAVLVQRALAGDQAAYAELMARHRRRLERYAWFLLGNREDAEEVLQDTFLRAFRDSTAARSHPGSGPGCSGFW